MIPLPAPPSFALSIGFVALPLVMAGAIAWFAGARWALGIAGWVALTGALAASGVLADFSLPPRALFVLLPTLVGVGLLARSDRLSALPLGLLIGFQAFRVPVELLIHQAVVEGVAPPQLTWPTAGYNLDVLTGLSAPLVAWTAPRWSTRALLVWNTAGLLLVTWVVLVAVVSMPTPFQLLRPDNVWVAWFPFIWLPVCLVGAAMLGHLLVYRRLLAGDR